MSQLNDISLVAQVVMFHNTRAFDQLVKKYQSAIRRFFLNLTCGDSELSDDLAQETFIKAARSLQNFRGECSEKTWLTRIAIRTCCDIRRGSWFRYINRKITPDMLPESAQEANNEDQSLTASVRD